MNLRTTLNAAALVAALLCPATASAQLSVVVHPDFKGTLTAGQVTDLFTGVAKSWPGGGRVQTVDQANTETGKAFYRLVVRQPASVVRIQWMQLVLSGQALPPIRAQSDQEVRAAVARTPGAIGYILTSAVDASVRVVLVLPQG